MTNTHRKRLCHNCQKGCLLSSKVYTGIVTVKLAGFRSQLFNISWYMCICNKYHPMFANRSIAYFCFLIRRSVIIVASIKSPHEFSEILHFKLSDFISWRENGNLQIQNLKKGQYHLDQRIDVKLNDWK